MKGKLTAVVEDEQLSLAIGKNGLNAELASQLTGLSVDIISNAEFAQREAEKHKEAGLLIELKGIGDKMVYNLNAFGVNTIKDLSNIDSDFLNQVPGIGTKTANKLIAMAKEYFINRDKLIR